MEDFAAKARAHAEENERRPPDLNFLGDYYTSVSQARKRQIPEPTIHEHWRRYAAFLLEIPLAEDQPRYVRISEHKLSLGHVVAWPPGADFRREAHA